VSSSFERKIITLWVLFVKIAGESANLKYTFDVVGKYVIWNTLSMLLENMLRLALSPAILTKRTHNVIIFLSKLEDTISLLRYYTKRCYDIILSLSLSTTKYSHLRNNISYLLNIHNSYMLPLYTKQYSSSENCKRDFICLSLIC
jgi:hypothetical protein